MQRHTRPFWNMFPISHMLPEKAAWCDITCCLNYHGRFPACHAQSLHRCKGYGPADWRPVLPVRSLQRWKSAPGSQVVHIPSAGGGPYTKIDKDPFRPQRCRWHPGCSCTGPDRFWISFQENCLKWKIVCRKFFGWALKYLFIVCVHLNWECICMWHVTCDMWI